MNRNTNVEGLQVSPAIAKLAVMPSAFSGFKFKTFKKNNKMTNLYFVTTQGLGDFHILANDPTEAQNALKKILDEQNYGTSDSRRITNIKWLAEAFGQALQDKSKPFLSDKSKRLLIVQH